MVTATSHKGDVLQAKMEIVFAHLNGEHQHRTLYEPEDYLKMMRMLRAYEIGHAADGSRWRSRRRWAAAPGCSPDADGNSIMVTSGDCPSFRGGDDVP